MFSANSYTATLAVSDISRAKEFYVGKLACTVIREDDTGVGLTAPGSNAIFTIYVSGAAGTNQATAMAFHVDDVDAAVAALQAAGVEMENYDFPGLKTVNGVAELEPGTKTGWFKDPDGNILAVGNFIWEN